MQSFFITGTDTDAGKTALSCALLHSAQSLGLRTLACKPVAAGCEPLEGALRNADALLLQQAITAKLDYQQVNPVALAEPVAPHISAARQKTHIELSELCAHITALQQRDADLLLIEGAGGWRVPLNDSETLADLAIHLKLPVILVVNMRLGCLNHALLTAQAVMSDGLQLAGWIANQCQPQSMAALEENIASLQARLPAPCLGVVPYLHPFSAERCAEHLDLKQLQLLFGR